MDGCLLLSVLDSPQARDHSLGAGRLVGSLDEVGIRTRASHVSHGRDDGFDFVALQQSDEGFDIVVICSKDTGSNLLFLFFVGLDMGVSHHSR